VPIGNDDIKQIETMTSDAGDLIKKLNPVTDAEWDAFNKLVDAHKNFQKVDTDGLRQLPLIKSPKTARKPRPREDCPRCQGRGEYVDRNDSSKTPRVCVCRDVEDAAWEGVKASWAKQQTPAEG